MAEIIHDLLAPHAAASPAIQAPDRATLTYGELRTLADATLAALTAMGIGRSDRVAIVLPNGPEMATAFLAVASAPRPRRSIPAYREDEFEFYLTDLKAKALIVAAGSDGPAVAVAARPASPIVRAAARRGRPGRRASRSPPEARGRGTRRTPGPPRRTTWRWCCTPPAPRRGRRSCRCSQRNLAASARHIGATLA